MKAFTVKACSNNIPDCIDFIERELSRLKVTKKERIRSVLSAEDVIACFIKHASEDVLLSVAFNRFMGSTGITVKCVGSEMDQVF